MIEVIPFKINIQEKETYFKDTLYMKLIEKVF